MLCNIFERFTISFSFILQFCLLVTQFLKAAVTQTAEAHTKSAKTHQFSAFDSVFNFINTFCKTQHTVVYVHTQILQELILRQRCLLLRRVCDVLNAVLHFARDVRCFAFSCGILGFVCKVLIKRGKVLKMCESS